CRVPIRYTDIDHNQDWANGGKTDISNLAPLCRRHHTLKTSAGWKITPHPGGVVEYITPAGYHYTEDPEPHTVTIPTHPGGGDIGGRNSGTSSDGEPPW
ncbi:HNH endonuclease signature motif containing protein, partial [Microbacterium sp. ZW T5_56]|uniref:HNH endonuclease signature motif containing protein n=1 Tax=Microbacterium sp. ZW T5_56 TaxID=3378081 RepID=UPI003852DB62